MNQYHRSGEVCLTMVDGQLQFTIVHPKQYRLPHSASLAQGWTRLLAAVVVATGMFVLPTVSQAATYSSTDVITATNNVRAQHGLATLTTNTTLTAAAMAKANDMFAQQYFNHYSPSGEAPWIFFKQAGYAYTAAGENLAIDFVDGGDIVPAWMGSPSHRDNILNPKYHDVGIAVVDGVMNGTPTTLVVQFFGSKQTAATTAKVVKPAGPTVVPTPAVHPVPAPEVPAPVATAHTEPAQAAPTIPASPVITAPTAPEPLAEVRGAATRVIPTVSWSRPAVSTLDPRIALLVVATLSTYLILLLGAASLQRTLAIHPNLAEQASQRT